MKPIAPAVSMIDLMARARRWRALMRRRGLFLGVDRLNGRPTAVAVESVSLCMMGGDSWGLDE
jgi:hypothetical protein